MKKKSKGGSKKLSFCSKTNANVDAEEDINVPEIVGLFFEAEQFEDNDGVSTDEEIPVIVEHKAEDVDTQAGNSKIEELQSKIFEVKYNIT